MPTTADRTAELDKEMADAGFDYQLRAADACKALGVSHETLRKLRADGLLRGHVINNEYRYSRPEIARFRAEGEAA